MSSFIVSAILLGLAVSGVAGDLTANGCLRLLGSAACPAFQTAYLSPGNLSNAFPFFSTVTDVKSFDAGAFDYFSNQYQFEATKFGKELGCSNASSAVLRWERTVLCSMWVNEQWSSECLAFYNGTTAATTQKMVCQETCLEYSANEYLIVNSTSYCPGADLTNGARDTQLIKDFTDCTNWTTLATNNSATCVLGVTNEGNCGFGSSTTQLCGYCSGSSPDSCCYSANTDVSTCGYVLPAIPSSSSASTSVMPTASGSLQNGSAASGLSGGQLAGTIVGSIIGGLLLLVLILVLILCLRRRKTRNKRDSSSTYAPDPNDPSRPQTGIFGSLFAGAPTSNKNPGMPNNNSEKGLLGSDGHYPNTSSPTMGGDTSYSGGKGSVDGTAFGMVVGAGMIGGRSSGIVLPRVRDENQNGDRWIETGAEVSVLWPYQAALPDELDLRPGMKLRVLRLYDDAWGTAQVLSGGEDLEIGKQGAFPIVCVSEGSTLGSSSPPTSSDSSH